MEKLQQKGSGVGAVWILLDLDAICPPQKRLGVAYNETEPPAYLDVFM